MLDNGFVLRGGVTTDMNESAERAIAYAKTLGDAAEYPRIVVAAPRGGLPYFMVPDDRKTWTGINDAYHGLLRQSPNGGSICCAIAVIFRFRSQMGANG